MTHKKKIKKETCQETQERIQRRDINRMIKMRDTTRSEKSERHTISQQIHYLLSSANILITPSAAFANKKLNVYKDLI